MTEVSSSGRAAPKIKSIDVQANLLSQRLADRERLWRASRRKLFAIGAVVTIAAGSLPSLYTSAAAASLKAAKAEKTAATVKGLLTKTREAAKVAEPKIQSFEMLQGSKKYARAFLAQVVATLNAPSDRVALSGLRAEVIGGDMKVSARADAEDYAAAEEFLAKARQGARPEDVGFNWTRRSDLLKLGGTSFELSRKVVLASP